MRKSILLTVLLLLLLIIICTSMAAEGQQPLITMPETDAQSDSGTATLTDSNSSSSSGAVDSGSGQASSSLMPGYVVTALPSLEEIALANQQSYLETSNVVVYTSIIMIVAAVFVFLMLSLYYKRQESFSEAELAYAAAEKKTASSSPYDATAVASAGGSLGDADTKNEQTTANGLGAAIVADASVASTDFSAKETTAPAQEDSEKQIPESNESQIKGGETNNMIKDDNNESSSDLVAASIYGTLGNTRKTRSGSEDTPESNGDVSSYISGSYNENDTDEHKKSGPATDGTNAEDSLKAFVADTAAKGSDLIIENSKNGIGGELTIEQDADNNLSDSTLVNDLQNRLNKNGSSVENEHRYSGLNDIGSLASILGDNDAPVEEPKIPEEFEAVKNSLNELLNDTSDDIAAKAVEASSVSAHAAAPKQTNLDYDFENDISRYTRQPGSHVNDISRNTHVGNTMYNDYQPAAGDDSTSITQSALEHIRAQRVPYPPKISGSRIERFKSKRDN